MILTDADKTERIQHMLNLNYIIMGKARKELVILHHKASVLLNRHLSNVQILYGTNLYLLLYIVTIDMSQGVE